MRKARNKRIESRRKAVYAVLETRIAVVPLDIVRELKIIDDADILEELLRKAATINDIQAFRDILYQILDPGPPT